MKPKLAFSFILVAAVGSAATAGLFAVRSFFPGKAKVASLAAGTHFHGIAVDAKDPTQLYLATHRGLYIVNSRGDVRLVSHRGNDCAGFAYYPGDSPTLYASGHESTGRNLGFISSGDGGRSWRTLAEGSDSLDFHQIDASKGNPAIIYGAYREIQKSTDGGRSWKPVGPVPSGLIDLAAGRQSDTLYAGTQQGLVRSVDGGRSWAPAYPTKRPVTAVQATPSGELFAFVVGIGLVRADERDLTWTLVGDGFGRRYMFHVAIAPGDGRRLYAIVFDPLDRSQSVMTSADGGRTWSAFGAG